MKLIGEMLNGASAAVAQAIEARDRETVRHILLRQAEAGADCLDLCPASPPKRETEDLCWLVEQAQAVTELPLCLDSPDPRVLAAAMERCAAPGILNSVLAEDSSTWSVLPRIAGTKWRCVVLFRGEEEALRQTAEYACSVGVQPEQLLADPGVPALAVTEDGLNGTLQALARAKAMGFSTAAAISNVSFGLPGRGCLQNAFAVLAVQAGLDWAILNPLDEELRRSLCAARALLEGRDACLDYIDCCRRQC